MRCARYHVAIRRELAVEGFSLVRQEGDHKIFTKAGMLRPLVIPSYRAVPVFIIRNLLRTSGRERYFELMEG